ncbi:MAG: FecR domain-containing protein [Nitrosomonas sp.]|nr:FecR domain-containing protein [Nitrosomonas sp.]
MPKPPSTDPENPPSSETSLAEEAASWFLRMHQSNNNDAEQKAFEAWLAQSSAHRAEYQLYTRLWDNLDYLEQKPRKKFRVRAASLLVLALIFSAMHWLSRIEDVIITAIGERERIVLADGTTIDINTGTKLRLAAYGFTRKVTIEHGEALFKIGAERFRAFEVHAGGGVIRDIGTLFNVARDHDKTTVAVLEGAVEIALDAQNKKVKTIHNGQQLSYTQRELSDISRADIETVTAWRNNRLIFRDTLLSEAVRQINRYHARPITLGETRLNTLKVSGEFNSADRAGLIQSLKALFPLQSIEQDEMTVLLSEK